MLASSSKPDIDFQALASTHENFLRELEADQARTAFAALHRKCVSTFHHDVFIDFYAARPSNLEPEVACALATKSSVLSTCSMLSRMGGRSDQRAKDFVAKFGWVGPAWEAAVQATGLDLKYYLLLRNVKDDVEGFFTDEEAKQALLSLEHGLIPAEKQEYKEPLMAMLRIVARS